MVTKYGWINVTSENTARSILEGVASDAGASVSWVFHPPSNGSIEFELTGSKKDVDAVLNEWEKNQYRR